MVRTLSGMIVAVCLAVPATSTLAQQKQQGAAHQPGGALTVLECFQRVLVPAQYTTKKVLVQPARRQYLQKGEILQLVEYPPVFREDKTLVKEEHHLLQKVSCDKVPAHLLPTSSIKN